MVESSAKDVAERCKWLRGVGFGSTALLLESQATRIATLSEALDRIIGMCDAPPTCKCGRPNGLGAVVSCARRALSAGQGEAK